MNHSAAPGVEVMHTRTVTLLAIHQTFHSGSRPHWTNLPITNPTDGPADDPD